MDIVGLPGEPVSARYSGLRSGETARVVGLASERSLDSILVTGG
jgi:hypothetical protein